MDSQAERVFLCQILGLIKVHSKLFQLLIFIVLMGGLTTSGNASDRPNKNGYLSEISEDVSYAGSVDVEIQTCTPFQQEQNEGIILRHIVKGKEVTNLGDSTLYDKDSDFKADVDAVVSPYVGEVISTAYLRAIQDELTLLYLQRGNITAWADCIELQDDGTLVIHVTEGFIKDVNVGRVGEAEPVYVPAEATQLGRDVLAYLTPILQDDNGNPQRPVNLSQLEDRIQLLSQDGRFASGETFSRLRVPTKSFLDKSIEILQQSLERSSLIIEPSEIEAAVVSLEKLKGTFNADTVEPGSSVLEIDLKVLSEDVSSVEDNPLAASLASSTVALENRRNDAFKGYFGREFERTLVDAGLIRFALHSLELQEPSIQAAVVYIASEGTRVSIRVETAYEQAIEIEDIARFEREEQPDEEFTYNADSGFTAVSQEDGETSSESGFLSFLRRGARVERDALVLEVESFWRAVQNPDSDSYLRHADQLYDLLIRPIKNEFDAHGIEINTLLVAMDGDLGLLPLASLYDSEEEQYLAEQYRLAIIPNFRSLDIRPSNLSQANILAMGASEFRETDRYAPLSAVPLELSLVKSIWSNNETQWANVYRNENFTLDNLRQQRLNHPYPIVHLASHANFRSGLPGDSSIQLWDTTLPLNELQLATLNFNNPPLELLVLSACQTALGSEEAVLGFAGSFLRLAEVKSVLASLWYVNDLTSLIYMMEFYRNLRTGVTKAEAVQNTQLAMLDEQRIAQNLEELNLVMGARLDDDRYLESLTEAEKQRLKELSDELNKTGKIAKIAEQFTHPFYWSAYTLVGNPW